jgi:hypothetical protein
MRKYVVACAVLLSALFVFNSSLVGQVPNLGTAGNFALFTTNGAITNTGISQITGNIGSNVGGSTGFGNVDGSMHNQDAASAQSAADLLVAYNQMNAAVPSFFPTSILGNGQTLNAGVYSISSNTSLNGILNLDAQGDPNAVFIFQIEGTLNTILNSEVKLLNGEQACNVFWKVEGAVGMAAGTKMRGAVVAHNGAISMGVGDTLEGHALSINGAISVNGIRCQTPTCSSLSILTGPATPYLGTTECFGLFSGIGAVTNVGASSVVGDVGTNSGATTGFNPATVGGTVHAIPDGITSQCATDFLSVYANLSALICDIELLYPAQFGNGLVLTPHAYLLNAAVTLTDSLFLNAQGNPNAVFIFHVNGAFGTSSFSNVILQNGAQAKNVFWLINGAITIGDNSVFNGTIISQGAINLMSGVTLYGRALTGVGAISTSAISTFMQAGCSPAILTQPLAENVCFGDTATFSVVATGFSLTYQWRLGLVNLIDGGNISGATTSTLTINPATDLDAASNYNVVVLGGFNPIEISNEVALNVQIGPLIIMQPQSQTICEGDAFSFTVLAVGTSLSFQWQRDFVNLIDGPTVSGATSNTLSILGSSLQDTGANYTVTVSGVCLPE